MKRALEWKTTNARTALRRRSGATVLGAVLIVALTSAVGAAQDGANQANENPAAQPAPQAEPATPPATPTKDRRNQPRRGTPAKPTPNDPNTPTPESPEDAAARQAQEEAARQAAERARQRQAQPAAPAQPPRQPVTQHGDPIVPGASPPGVMGTEGAPPTSPTTPLNIPPSQSDVPPEARRYVFSIKDGTYEQLVEGFARQTGLGVMGDAPKDGKVSFVSTQELSFLEALSRVRMLLFNYKPLEPYWMRYDGTHLRVVRINDLYRELRPDQMFRSVDEFTAAGLPDEELALVIYTPKEGTISDLRIVRDFLPDYMRVAPFGDNSVTIFALVRDINRYLEFAKIFRPPGQDTDPRALERIEVKHLLASEAVTKLQLLMDVAPDGKIARTPARAQREPNPIEPMPEPPLTMIPDDSQGVIVVRAMQDRIAEIRRLLPFIDVDTTGGALVTEVIPVLHTDPTELVSTLQQILQATVNSLLSEGGGPAPSAPTPAGGVKPGPPKTVRRPQPTPAGGVDGVTMIVHPSQDAIIAVANPEMMNRVRDLVQRFDVEGRVGPIKMPLLYADPQEVGNTLTQVFGAVPGKAGAVAIARMTVVPDTNNHCIWFSGTEKDLAKVREIVAGMDVAGDAIILHTFKVKSQLASFSASVLREFDQGSPTPVAGAPPATPGGKPNPSAPRPSHRNVSASKFTPNDEQGIVYVLCTNAEWEVYRPVLEGLETAVTKTDAYERLELKHIDSTSAVDQLMTLIGGDPKNAALRFIPADKVVYVIGADSARMETIRKFLEEIDRPLALEKRTFEIRFAEPTEIKLAIDALIGTDAARQAVAARPPQPRPEGARPVPSTPTVGPGFTVIQLGNRLVVQTTPKLMADVAGLIAELDVETQKSVMKVYRDFPPGANISSIADTLASIFAGPTAPGVPPSRGPVKGQEGTRFLPRVSVGELVVIASPTMFPKIEELLEVLKRGREGEAFVVELIDVAHTDVDQLVDMITPLLELKVRQLITSGHLPELTADLPQAVPAQPGVRPQRGMSEATHEYFHLDADTRSRRIVIAAPKALVDEARALVGRLDKPGSEMVLRHVTLVNSDPTEMVSAVREMLGGTKRTFPTKSTPQRPVTAPATTVVEAITEGPITVFEAPGGGAIVLYGPPKDLDRAIEWIHQLDAVSTRGRKVKVFTIQNADVLDLGDLIVAVVDTGSSKAPKPIAPPIPKSSGTSIFPSLGGDEEEDLWETSKTWNAQDLYMKGDSIAGTLVVAASPSVMPNVESLIAQFDDPEVAGGLEEKPMPRRIYELQFADPYDAEDAADLLFDEWYADEKVKPSVSKGIGNSLIVKYPDESKFDEIEKLIRDHVDKPDPEKSKVVTRSFKPPTAVSAEQAVLWLIMNHPEVEFETESVSEGGTKNYGMERLGQFNSPKPNPCVLPGALTRMVDEVIAAVLGQPPEGQEEPPPHEEPMQPNEQQPVIEPVPNPIQPMPIQPPPDFVQRAATSLQQPPASTKGGTGDETDKDKEKTVKRAPPGTKIKLKYDPEKGTFQAEGPMGVMEDVKDWMKDLEDEVDTIDVPPDIRIYRVKYIDVHTATDVLEEMFNATRQQRGMVDQQQQQMMQMMQQQRMQQQLQQQQLQQQAQQQLRQQQAQVPVGGKGQPGKPEQQQPGQMPPGFQMPQLPPTAVRVYPHPRERALILRADTSQYPAILELLATIDRPQPIDSEFKIFPLKKLNAAEVEVMLAEMLGLDERAARPQAAPAGAPGAPAGGRRGGRSAAGGTEPGGRLPKTLMTPMATGLGELGVDPEDIKLSSNEAANTIMVMAPKRAVEFIGDIIHKLESEEMPERIAKYYQLQFADAEEAADYLGRHFEESPAAGASTKGPAGAAAGAGRSAKALNTPSFVAYPRLNLLTALATNEQHVKIDEIIKRLDVKEAEKWEDVPLIHVDAKAAADTLERMFGAKSAAASGKGREGGATGGGQSAKFVGDEGGRVLFFSAPLSLREPILTAIAKLEQDAKGTTTVRVIDLKYATPSKVAEAIDGAYGGRGAAVKGAARPAPAGFSVTASDPAKKLFVKADDALFAEIEGLVKTMDRPGTIDVELRVYPLKYANARQVHTTMTKMLKDYMTRIGPGGLGEAFSVEADDRANALVALGNDTVFKFLEDNLPKVDVPSAATGKPSSMMVAIKFGDAVELAANIQKLYNEKTLPGETPPTAEANRAANLLYVRGTEKQLEDIRREVIDPFEKQSPTVLKSETIRLQFADAEAVAETINRTFEDLKKAQEITTGAGVKVPAQHFTVIVTPDANTKQVTIHANEENMALVKARIAELDRKDVAETIATTVKVYPVKFADPSSVVRIISEWSKTRPQPPAGSKKQGEVIAATAETVTKTVVVTASHSNHIIIQGMIEGVDKEEYAIKGAEQTKSIKLAHADPGTVQDAIQQLFKGGTGPGKTPVTAFADYGSRSVLVSASSQDIARIEDLISKLDTPESTQLDVHVVQLSNASAESVARTLMDVYVKAQPQRGGGQAPAVTISALQGSQAILVKSNPTDFADIEAVIKQLDREEAMLAEVTRVIPLRFGDATEALESLKKWLEKPGGTGGGRAGDLVGDARVSALTQSNAIVASGGKEIVDRIENTIKEWDEAGKEGSGVMPKIIKLTHVNAGQMAANLQETFGKQPTGGGRAKTPPVIIADEANKSLIVRAGLQDMAAIESLVAQLDQEGTKFENFKVVQVAPGTNVEDLAEKVADSVNSSVRERPGGTGREAPEIVATPDRRTNSIILAGSPALFADAEQLIRTMEKLGPTGGKSIIVLDPGNVPVEDLRKVIDQLKGEEGKGGSGSSRRSTRPRSEPAARPMP